MPLYSTTIVSCSLECGGNHHLEKIRKPLDLRLKLIFSHLVTNGPGLQRETESLVVMPYKDSSAFYNLFAYGRALQYFSIQSKKFPEFLPATGWNACKRMRESLLTQGPLVCQDKINHYCTTSRDRCLPILALDFFRMTNSVGY